jgi:REP element-mobilizing transposase RayT
MKASEFLYKGHRNSYTELNEVYFWTITINKWQHLLKQDKNKMIVINSLQWLVQNALVKIYGYVVMPNHIHLMWEQLIMNGKEFPKNSFEKFTAKTLVNKLKQLGDTALKDYAVTATDRQYNIWQRDPLAVLVTSREMAAQKLEYMHLNPMQPHWLLCSNPADYQFSSAMFYEQNVDEFGLLTHFRDVF